MISAARQRTLDSCWPNWSCFCCSGVFSFSVETMSSRMRPARGETRREEELRQTIGIARCSCRGLHDRADIRVPKDDSLCTKKENIKVHAAGKLTKSCWWFCIVTSHSTRYNDQASETSNAQEDRWTCGVNSQKWIIIIGYRNTHTHTHLWSCYSYHQPVFFLPYLLCVHVRFGLMSARKEVGICKIHACLMLTWY